MSDGAFRDDHEAALARADALQAENQRLAAELEHERARTALAKRPAAPIRAWRAARSYIASQPGTRVIGAAILWIAAIAIAILRGF